MCLDDYINLTETPEASPATSAASLLGTVYSEAAFLAAFAPTQGNHSSQQPQQKQLLSSAVPGLGTTSTKWQH